MDTLPSVAPVAKPGMTIKTKAIIVAVYSLGLFAAGRYTVPEKIKIETKVVEVESKQEKKTVAADKERHKKTVVVEVDKPDGTREKTITTTDDTSNKRNTNLAETEKEQKFTDNKKEVTSASDKVTLSALAGASLTGGGLVYGASVTKPVLGPISIGLWGLTNSTIGGSLGLTF